jgi:L-arabonate dehydrase
LDVPETELERRSRDWRPAQPDMVRGYVSLYVKHVQQADKGADMDFLVGKSGDTVAADSH